MEEISKWPINGFFGVIPLFRTVWEREFKPDLKRQMGDVARALMKPRAYLPIMILIAA